VKLHILSDLHVEFGDFVIPAVGADLVVLAGDTHVGVRGVRWVRDQSLAVPVIYVAGNHEFYGHDFPGLIDALRREAENTNVTVLENDVLERGDFRFFGGTLWSAMDLFGDARAAAAVAAKGMNDYHRIRSSHNGRRLRPEETVAWHRQSVRELVDFLESGDPARSVVVTHGCPSIRSIPARYQDHPLVPAFAADMERIILDYQPRLWIHGHTHDSFDYYIGTTRIICNPRGYVPDADNPEFEAGMVVQLQI
jgi:Icc-related predicted phosphoesterase